MTEKQLGPATVQPLRYITNNQLFLKLLLKTEVFQLILTYLAYGTVSRIAVKGQRSAIALSFTLVFREHSGGP